MVSARVYKILSLQLGVKELNIVDIIYHHIIPQFKKDSIKVIKTLILLTYNSLIDGLCSFLYFSFRARKINSLFSIWLLLNTQLREV